MKTCKGCGKELPIEQFVFKNKIKNKRCAQCKTCDNARKRKSYRKHYQKNKDKFAERRLQFKQKSYDFINQFKTSGCCCCDEKDIACLDFHHLGDKEYNISEMAQQKSLKDIQVEISKCVILCSNCHRKLHFYNLDLPQLKKI